MCAPDAPTPPDPVDTSKAQTGTSVATAVANTALGNQNQVGADGSTLTYDQTGTTTFHDPYTNETYYLPQYTATQRLGEQSQRIYDAGQDASENLANTARDQSAFLQDYLGSPWQADTSEIEKHLFDLGSNTLDPKFARQRDDLATQLSNQGIKLGTAAYDRAMGNQSDAEGNAYNDLALRGRGQAFGELQAQRNQPINEISALMSGSQVSMPNYDVNTPSAIPTTDNAGLINQNFNAQMQQWQQQSAQSGGLFGGLAGLGGTLGGAAIMASDIRVKTNIKKIGKTDDGQQLYSFNYKTGGPLQIGLMAQDVEKINPDAVVEIGGVKHVNYDVALGGVA